MGQAPQKFAANETRELKQIVERITGRIAQYLNRRLGFFILYVFCILIVDKYITEAQSTYETRKLALGCKPGLTLLSLQNGTKTTRLL
jgi:hypothetical protein